MAILTFGIMVPGYELGNLVTIGRFNGPHFRLTLLEQLGICALANALIFALTFIAISGATPKARSVRVITAILWIVLLSGATWTIMTEH
jgi:amino acid transporter